MHFLSLLPSLSPLLHYTQFLPSPSLSPSSHLSLSRLCRLHHRLRRRACRRVAVEVATLLVPCSMPALNVVACHKVEGRLPDCQRCSFGRCSFQVPAVVRSMGLGEEGGVKKRPPGPRHGTGLSFCTRLAAKVGRPNENIDAKGKCEK